MWKITIRGLRARKVRLFLTTLAVVLGVSFVTGVFVFTDTLYASFRNTFRGTAVDVDLVVRSTTETGAGGGGLQRRRIPDGVLASVRDIPGVAAADGVVQGTAKLVDRDGEVIQDGVAPTLGISWPTVEGVGPLRLVGDDSRAPRRRGQVAIDSGTAEAHGYEVGDEIGVQVGDRAVAPYRIVGLFEFGDVSDLGGITFAAFDFDVAQQAFDAREQLDFVNVRAEPGASLDALRSELSVALGPRFDVVDAEAAADDLAEPVLDALDLLRQLLLAFGAVGVFAGAFIIVNTFSILVSQRTRELGLLRACGASGRQVIRAVLAEAAVVAAVASIVGSAAGLGLAAALLGLFGQFGFDVPDAPTVLLARTLVAAVIIGLGVTVISAVFPALRAARTPPVVAVAHEAQAVTTRPGWWRFLVGLVVAGGGVTAILVGTTGDFDDVRLAVITTALGCFTLFLGTVLLLPVITRGLVRVLATPVAAVVVGLVGVVVAILAGVRAAQLAGDDDWPTAGIALTVVLAALVLLGAIPALRGVLAVLARGNAVRNPRRTTATASALVLGITLVCLVAIVASSIRLSLQSGIEQGVDADTVLSGEQLAPISPTAIEEVAETRGVREVVGLSFGSETIEDRSRFVAGVNVGAFEEIVDVDLAEGQLEGLRDGVLISSVEAERLDVGVGEFLPFANAVGAAPVIGIFENRTFTGSVVVDYIIGEPLFEDSFGDNQQVTLAFVQTDAEGVGDVPARIDRRLSERFPDIRVQTLSEFQAEQDRSIDLIVNVLLGLLVFALLIAVLGIVNTLFLSVFERTRELGLLRVVGMTAKQMRRMVRGEAIAIALIGCVFGLLTGLVWGWAITTALHDEGVDRLSIPPVQIALFVALGAAAGVLASLWPARRAGRLDVLEAIAEE